MILNKNDEQVPYTLTEEECMWKIGYYICLGKTFDEIQNILKRSFEIEIGIGEVKYLYNLLKIETKAETDIQMVTYFKEKDLPPFKEIPY